MKSEKIVYSLRLFLFKLERAILQTAGHDELCLDRSAGVLANSVMTGLKVANTFFHYFLLRGNQV